MDSDRTFCWYYKTFENAELKTAQKGKIDSRKCQDLNRLNRWNLQSGLTFAELNGITTFEEFWDSRGTSHKHLFS